MTLVKAFIFWVWLCHFPGGRQNWFLVLLKGINLKSKAVMFTSFSLLFGIRLVVFLSDGNKSLFCFLFFLRLVIEHTFFRENTALNKFLFISRLKICFIESKEAYFKGYAFLFIMVMHTGLGSVQENNQSLIIL